MENKNFLRSILVASLFVIASITASAQPGDPDPPGDDPVPISGIEWLLLAGGAMGGYKLLRKDNQKKA